MFTNILASVSSLNRNRTYYPQKTLQQTDEPFVYQKELATPPFIFKVIEKIQSNGYSAYLVGGCVRDLLIGIKPKDFDIATDARPQQLLKIFPHKSSIIGRRFPIVHVLSGAHRLEVTTFRGTPPKQSPYIKKSRNGQILVDNHYGGISEDALRRDLTINALYYDPVRTEVIDYVDGLEDIRSKKVRVIGEPAQRFREDPARMLRCVRLANKLGFRMEKSLISCIKRNAQLVQNIAPARLFEELLKLTLQGQAQKNVDMMIELHIFQTIFVPLYTTLSANKALSKQFTKLINIALTNTDKRIAEGKTITPSFLLAALLWPQVCHKLGIDVAVNRHKILLAGREVLEEQQFTFRIPKRFSSRMLSFWQIQYDLQWPIALTVVATIGKHDFRASYDFLLIREQSGELADYQPHLWWQDIQDVSDQAARDKMIKHLPKRKNNKIIRTLSTSYFSPDQ